MTQLLSIRFVTLKRFEELSGYTEKAVRAKAARGDWLEGREFKKAPDGRLLVDLWEYEKWVLGEAPAAFGLQQPTASRSTSTTAMRAVASG